MYFYNQFSLPIMETFRHLWGPLVLFLSIKRGSVWMKSCFFTYFSLTSVRHWPVIIRPFLTVLQHGTTVHLWGQWTACPTSWPGVCIRHNLRPECFCTFRLISGLSLGTADVRSGGPDGTRHLSTGPAVSCFLACPGREQGPCWGASCAPQPATAVPLQDLVTLPTALSQPFLTFQGPVLIPRAPSSTPRTCMPLPGHCYVPPPQPFSCRSRPQHAPVPASSSSSRPWSYCGHLPQLCGQTPYSSASADDDGFDSPDTHTPIPPPTPNTPPPHPTTTPPPRTPHTHTPHPTPTPPHPPHTPHPHPSALRHASSTGPVGPSPVQPQSGLTSGFPIPLPPASAASAPAPRPAPSQSAVASVTAAPATVTAPQDVQTMMQDWQDAFFQMMQARWQALMSNAPPQLTAGSSIPQRNMDPQRAVEAESLWWLRGTTGSA